MIKTFFCKILPLVLLILVACTDKQAQDYEDLRIRYKTISYSELEERAENFDTIIARYTTLKQPYLNFVGQYREGKNVDYVLEWLDTINRRQQYWEQLQQDVWSRLKNINANPSSVVEACLTEQNLNADDYTGITNPTAQQLILREIDAIRASLTKRKEELYGDIVRQLRPSIAAEIEKRVRQQALTTHAYTQVSAIAGLDTAQTQKANIVSLQINYDVTLTKKNYALMDAGSTGTMRLRGTANAVFSCSDQPKIEYSTAIVNNIPAW